MSDVPLVLAGMGAVAVSGVPGLMLSRYSMWGQWIATLLAVGGSIAGLVGVCQTFELPTAAPMVSDALQPIVRLSIAIDGVSIIFLTPIFLISLLGSIYGLAYWRQIDHPRSGRQLQFFLGLLTAAMALVVIARDGMLFLAAWEIMAVSAFFLVITEDEKEEVREAGWLYLALTHTGTMCLIAMFGLLWTATGSFDIAPVAAHQLSPGMATAIFLLALVGFGCKAGVMPLHIWLPSSHANAPSHVSALMSGVIIKMGIYGLVRVLWITPSPPLWWGVTLLVLGVISGILGVAFAIGQHDLKRLLAYHSIENIGIIVMGLGLAMIGRSQERGDFIVLGLAGALLHVWNHALFKSLLFLSAGSVIHAVDTREIDHMGGLAKRMPLTAFCFMVGAVAICGLPPLNGFVSELCVYIGLFRSLTPFAGAKGFPVTALASVGLALIGALALACFVKVFGAVFLGEPRTKRVEHAHESSLAMIGPMFVLVACCVAIGARPEWVAPMLDRAIADWLPAGKTELMLIVYAPLAMVSLMAGLLTAGLVGIGLLLKLRMATRPLGSSGTWDCGYAAPTARMQYTSSSFAEMLVKLFAWALRPKVEQPRIEGLFPARAHFASDVPDTVLEQVALPATRLFMRGARRLCVLQQGDVHLYLLYIFMIVVVLLFWR